MNHTHKILLSLTTCSSSCSCLYACKCKLMPMASVSSSAANANFVFVKYGNGGRYRCRPFLVLSGDRRGDVHTSLTMSLLGPPTRFEASKLKVVFMGEEMEKQQLHPYNNTIPRAYTITHCDFTANLTLAVSTNITITDKLQDWQTTLQRDDVVAEWKNTNEEMGLHVHCYVSGANLLQALVAGLRYHVFAKELPLVLKAVVHGDSTFFSDHPELLEAKVWVYFHSKSRKYNRVECWGPLKDAIRARYHFNRHMRFEGQPDDFQSSAIEAMSKLISPKAIFQTLVTFLL